MFDLAWSHILLIGVVALLVIGPKDLPRALRTLGVWVGRARAIAREFQNNLDQMIREAELEEMRKQVEKAATLDLDQTIEKAVDPGGELKRTFAASPVPEKAPPLETKPGGETKAAPETLPAPPAPPETPAADAPAAASGTRD
ncbi:MAG TPA: Sec-independent protein translocase protein TatB [Stellaceae bacterium]|nr:Sec-independent protein translocase protein TatB [Stellaceae bacterium]